MPPEDLTSIDVTQLDALAKLEADHKSIQSLSGRAAWRRDKEVEIYTRVMADYEARMKALADQATPIRQRVRDDLQKLDAIWQRCGQSLDQAKGKLQECEFRHEIGEFTVEQFEECQQEAEQLRVEREAEFEEVSKLRQRYVELLPNEPPPPPPPPPPAPAKPTKKPSTTASSSVAAAVPPPPPAPPPVPPSPPPAAAAPPVATSAPTMSLPSQQPPPPAPVATPPAPAAAAPPAAAAQTPDNATMFIRPPSSDDFKAPPGGAGGEEARAYDTISVASAMLIEDRGGLPGAHYRLGSSTSIGRTQDNQIVVAIKEVSRRHAKIVMSENGYVLKDLGSPNGTFVNGQRITEQRLREGDKIEMGGKLFIFSGPS